jgi:hypothetical protein
MWDKEVCMSRVIITSGFAKVNLSDVKRLEFEVLPEEEAMNLLKATQKEGGDIINLLDEDIREELWQRYNLNHTYREWEDKVFRVTTGDEIIIITRDGKNEFNFVSILCL